MFNARIMSVVLVWGLAVCSLSQGRIIYVDDDANLGGDGICWETAYKFLQDAVALLDDLGDTGVEIRIAQGTYLPDRDEEDPQGTGKPTESFTLSGLDCNVVMRGGYAGLVGPDPKVWDIEAYRTILSGDLSENDIAITDAQLLADEPTRQENAYNIMNVDLRHNTVELDGLTFCGGQNKYDGGGAIAFVVYQDDGGTVRNCRFVENYCANAGGAIYSFTNNVNVIKSSFECNASFAGGGAAINIGNFRECQFIGNFTHSDGGALYEVGGIDKCLFKANCAVGDGGAICSYNNSEITNSFFIQNHCNGWGGGIVSMGISHLKQCALIDNFARYGGGLAFSSDQYLIEECLIVGNYANECGGGVFVNGADSVLLKNCTIVDNRSPQGSFLATRRNPYQDGVQNIMGVQSCIINNDGVEIWNNEGVVGFTYSCLSQGLQHYYDPNQGIALGVGNIHVDPCFVDPGYWDANDTPSDPKDDFYVVGEYHLKSQAGRWDPNSESWVCDEVTSPCIDAGDPNSDIGWETAPHGGVINMGVYGGTLEASRSVAVVPSWQERYEALLATIEPNDGVVVSVDVNDGYLKEVTLEEGAVFTLPNTDSMAGEEVALAFVEQWQDLFMVDSGAMGLAVDSIKEEDSSLIVELDQTYAGLSVHGAEVTAVVVEGSGVNCIACDLMVDPCQLEQNLSLLQPTLTQEDAEAIATDPSTLPEVWILLGIQMDISSDLRIFSPQVVGGQGEPRLVWSVLISADLPGACSQRRLIDGHTGELLFTKKYCPYPSRD